jgi:hypothetical protein
MINSLELEIGEHLKQQGVLFEVTHDSSSWKNVRDFLVFYMTFLIVFVYVIIVSASFFFGSEEYGHRIRFLFGDFMTHSGFPVVYEMLTLLVSSTAFSTWIVLFKERNNKSILEILFPKSRCLDQQLDCESKTAYYHCLLFNTKIFYFTDRLYLLVLLCRLYPWVIGNMFHKDLEYAIKSTIGIFVLSFIERKTIPFIAGICCIIGVVTQFIRLKVNSISKRFESEMNEAINKAQSFDEQLILEITKVSEEMSEVIRSSDDLIGGLTLAINILTCPTVSLVLTSLFMEGAVLLKILIMVVCGVYIGLNAFVSISVAYTHSLSQQGFRIMTGMYTRMDNSVSLKTRLTFLQHIRKLSSGCLSFSNGVFGGHMTPATIADLFVNTIQLTLMTFTYLLTPGEILVTDSEL